MANPAGTIEIIVKELGLVFKPLENLLNPYFTEILGLRLPEAIADNAQWKQALDECLTAVSDMVTALDNLTNAITDEDIALIIVEGKTLISRIKDVVEEMKNMSQVLENVANGASGLSGDEKDELKAFAGEIVRKLVDYLIVENIESRFEANAALLNITGILERKEMPGEEGKAWRPPYIQKQIHFDRISDLLSDPANYLSTAYQWGTDDFEIDRLLEGIKELIVSLELPVHIYTIGNEKVLEATLFSISQDINNKQKLDFTINFPAVRDFIVDFPIAGVWSSTINISSRFEAGFGGSITPPFDIEFQSPSLGAEFSLLMGVKAEDASGPMVIFGQTDASRMEAQRFSAELGVSTKFEGLVAQTEPVIRSEIVDGKIIIDFSEGDGFLTSILSGIDLQAIFNLIAKWQPSKGLQIEGSGGIEIAIPTHIQLGPVKIQQLYLALLIDAQSAFKVEISSGLGLDIGPFQAVIERMGLAALFDIADNRDGNLGPLDVSFAFKPPNGIGMALDTGAVIGGGYIFFFPEKGEYGGVAELTVIDLVSVKAVCIITTKNPDGSKGFSFLLLITAEFTPIQLGFGFTLNGVGGLIAINRGIQSSAIAQGVRDNTTDAVLFPDDPVANAPMIIASMNKFFPISQDQYAFGFMGIIGWGTPTLISLEMGLMFTFPEPVSFIILGELKMVLPDERAPIINFQVNFFGEINFTEKYMFFFASIYNSRIAYWTVSGEMYFSIDWGANPNFVFSVGGFHPDYIPPALRGGIGQLKRITLNLLSGNNPRLTLSFYMAVTSNTVQFGAAADFMAKAWKIRVVGYLYFDALFQFNPFYFKISIGAGLAVMWGSKELFGIHLSGSLEGPSPWRIKGKATFKILFVKVKVRVDKTFGERENTSLPPKPILPFIQVPLRDKRNWIASKPSSKKLLVSTRKLELEDLVVHPYSIIGVSQNRVPLHIDLDKVGSNEPADYIKFKLKLDIDDDSDKITDFFAPAEYIDLSNAEKLSRKSFEKFTSGIKAQGQDAFSSGETRRTSGQLMEDYVEKALVHEVCVIDKLEEEPETGNRLENPDHFAMLVQGNAVARSTLGRARTLKNGVLQNRVTIEEEKYQIVNTTTLGMLSKEGSPMTFNTETQAKNLVRQLEKKQPKLKGLFQVISSSEMN